MIPQGHVSDVKPIESNFEGSADHALANAIETWVGHFMQNVALDMLKLRTGVLVPDEVKRFYIRLTDAGSEADVTSHFTSLSAAPYGSVVQRDVRSALTSFIQLFIEYADSAISCVSDLAFKVLQSKVYIWLSISWTDEELADKLECAAFLAQARASRDRLSSISLMIVDAEKQYAVPTGYKAVLVNGEIYGESDRAPRQSAI